MEGVDISKLPGEVTIRRLQAHDLERVRMIAATSPEAASWSLPGYQAILSEPSKYQCWVAAYEGLVVAFACFRVLDDEAELLNLAVLPAWRRQGIASRLMEHILREAAKAGAAEMLLEVRDSNQAALQLYAGFGFVQCGSRPGYYEAPPADALLLHGRLRHTSDATD